MSYDENEEKHTQRWHLMIEIFKTHTNVVPTMDLVLLAGPTLICLLE